MDISAELDFSSDTGFHFEMMPSMPEWVFHSPDIAEIAAQKADEHGIDKNLVLAIITVESNGNRYALRYEPAWPDKWLLEPREIAENLGITVETETVLQKMSWGPMQIMGATARGRLGFRLELVHLLDPEIGIEYGVKYLAELCRTYSDQSDVIVSYNAGSPKKDPSGMYRNQNYLDRVNRILLELNKLK